MWLARSSGLEPLLTWATVLVDRHNTQDPMRLRHDRNDIDAMVRNVEEADALEHEEAREAFARGDWLLHCRCKGAPVQVLRSMAQWHNRNAARLRKN